jgi:hypothetical protein
LVFASGSLSPKQALALTRPATVAPASSFTVIDVIILFINFIQDFSRLPLRQSKRSFSIDPVPEFPDRRVLILNAPQ